MQVRSPLGPSAEALVCIMKGHVMEDRGQLPVINEAVYAAAAAMILHNNLGKRERDRLGQLPNSQVQPLACEPSSPYCDG